MCRSHSQAMVTNSCQEKDAGWERDSIVPFHLIVILLLFLLVVDLEVAELVGVLGRGNHAQPITQIVLFKVLQVTLGESDVSGDNELRFGPLDGNVGAEISGLALDLNTLVEIFLKVGGIHNAILDGLRAVEDELVLDLLLGSTLSLGRSLLDSTRNHF